MKKRLLLALCAATILYPACSPSYIKVLERKGSAVPFTNIVAFYVNEACNFSLADSTGYNICLKASFDDSKSVEERGRVERLIAASLGTAGTRIISASELLGVNGVGTNPDNSYSRFRQLLGSLRIDGILVIQVHNMQKEHYRTPGTSGPVGKSGASYFIPGGEGVAVNAAFDCFLIEPKDLNDPIWKAAMETKMASVGHEFDRKMTLALAKSLKEDGYIVH